MNSRDELLGQKFLSRVYLIHPQVINQKYNRAFLREEYEYQKDEFESVMQNNNFVRLDEFHLNYQTGLK